MIETKNKRVSNMSVFILMLLMCFSMIFSSVTLTANAAEPISPAENIVNNATFITWRKGQDERRGRFIYCNIYVPDNVYSTDFTYNGLACPKKFLTNNNIHDNYYEKLEATGEAILKYDNMTGYKAPEGRIYKFGINNIPDRGLDMELTFIFYVMDNTGTKTYFEPVSANYAGLTVRDYSNEELVQMLNQKVEMNSNFENIVIKIQELVNSIWKYIVMGLASVIIVWGAYVGIRIAVAKKNDEKINARGMVKNLIVGIVIMFILAMGTPLLINGLSAWIK